MAARKLPTYYGSGRTSAHLVGEFTKAGALRAGNKFLSKDLKDAGFSVSVFESENGYYVINIGKTMKKNPAPKRKTAARTQRAAESYVRRPSQITKKAPSKRLKKRRTVNLQSPRGVFPNPISQYIVYSELKPGYWKQVRVTENFEVAKKLAISNANAGAASVIEDSYGTILYDTTRPTKYELKNNPDSVHFDIDVNSHNAKGAKARTRVNPAARKKQIIVEYELSGQNFAIRNRGMYGWKELATFPDTPEGSENAIQYAQAYHKIAPHLRIQVVTK